MMKATIQLDTKKLGRIKQLNGGCLGPKISSENAGQNYRKYFADLHLPITRLHDAPLDNSGLNLVDVPMIFPLFHADANDPANYNFKATDDYIKACLDCGTQVYYRLGGSIDHSYKKYVIDPPADTQKWIEIVSHIIDHYNHGWADGFYYNIKYWEIWNEPEGISSAGPGLLSLPTMWLGKIEEYHQFYADVAKALKARYPELKIGGPSNCGWGISDIDHRHAGKEFLQSVHELGAPLDFYSFHIYACSLDWCAKQFSEIRATLDLLGFENTEIHITEWGYCPSDGFARMRENNGRDAASVYAEKGSSMAGAFINCALIHWQELPIEQAHHYTVSGGGFGLYDMCSHQPTKAYYALKAFGEMAFFYPERIAAEIAEFSGEPLPCKTQNREFDFQVIAGEDNDGNVAVLVSNYRYGAGSIEFDCSKLGYFSRAELQIVDDHYDLEGVATVESVNGKLTFFTNSNSSILLLRLIK